MTPPYPDTRLISPSGNAAFLSPHFDAGTKGSPLGGSPSRTRSVRHTVVVRFALYAEEYARARVHVDVQKGDIIPVNAMQAR